MKARTLIAALLCALLVALLSTGASAHGPADEPAPDPNAPTDPPADPVEGAPIPPPDDAQENVNEVDPFGTNRRSAYVKSLPEKLVSCSLHVRDLLGGGTFREDLGLPAAVDRSSATEVRYGIRVTPTEAEFLDNNISVRASVDTVKIDEVLRGCR
ncbi:MAG: hypothetical protein ACFCVK_11040 [Acidimicrobiales bacterium]